MNKIIFIIPVPALAIVHGPPLRANVVPSSVQTYGLLLFLPLPRELVHISRLSPLLGGTAAGFQCHISIARFYVLP